MVTAHGAITSSILNICFFIRELHRLLLIPRNVKSLQNYILYFIASHPVRLYTETKIKPLLKDDSDI